MLINSVRTLDELREVLRNPKATGPENAYWVFSQLGHKKWENMTITTPGLYDTEFPKTYGHYHSSSDEVEIYKLISGQGVFLLQKKHIENGKPVYDLVDEVFLVGAEPGDEIVVKPEYGHSWSNVGSTPLITYDNWRYGHVPQDYEPIRDLQGMAYYLISDSKGIELVPNPKYRNHPKPKWLTAKEFMQLFD
ncbi:hypothetical protein GYA27_00755 [candidate division WWE3 bacterium]|uniref:glucose-6-phosphate isomerase n=1 Tax=candidate division WWE3 bacterium TaxID=2053526 RepID=A0A7X9DK54_UNCKA|nr:hypothetical protein [candidate division WWE3 bacterium]